MMRSVHAVVLGTLALAVGACEPEPETGAPEWSPKVDWTEQFFTPEGELQLRRTQVLYVPVYSSILTGAGAPPTEMAATLAIRNTDRDAPIFVTSIEYYDTAGKPLETFLDGTHGLGPLASASIVINVSDTRGGFGANFIVEWGAEAEVSDPVVETIMVGSSGTKGFSFTSPARVVETSDR